MADRAGQFLNAAADVRWLKETHLRGRKYPAFSSFVLYGNEDAPDKVILYAKRVPMVSTPPVATITFNDNPYSRRAQYRHHRVRAPSRFVRGSLRTVKAGRARVIVGHLKGSRQRTRTGRQRQVVQSVLTPKRGRRNPAVSESRTLDAIRDLLYRANRARSFQQSRRMVSEAIGLVTLLAEQARAGIHANPTLAIVGANPPRGGRKIGYARQVVYVRAPGLHGAGKVYQHRFKTREACVYGLADGSILIRG